MSLAIGPLDGVEEAAPALSSAFRDDGHPPSQWRRHLLADLEARRIDPDASKVARLDGVVVGVAIARWVDDAGERIGHLGSTGVRPAFARRGIGRALVQAALGALDTLGCSRITLEVAAENSAARALYESVGFETRRELLVWSLTGRSGAPAGRRAAPVEVLLARPETRPAFQRRSAYLRTFGDLDGWICPSAGPPRAGLLRRGEALFDLWTHDPELSRHDVPPGRLTLLHEPAEETNPVHLALTRLGAEVTGRFLELERRARGVSERPSEYRGAAITGSVPK